VNGYLLNGCAEIDPNWAASASSASAVRNQVLALPWDAVCNGDDTLGDLLHTYYGQLDPGTVSVRRLLSLLKSYASSQRKGIAVGAKYRAEILYNGKRVWFDRDGGKHAFDEEACEAGELDRTVHVHISEVKNGGYTYLKISSQTAENLPFFKGCHLEDTTNEHWVDLTAWGYSTYNKNKDRPPLLTATMQRGLVHVGENGERQVYWTQYITTGKGRKAHPLPPGFSFIEYVEDEATDMDSSAGPSTPGAITVFDAHTTQLRSRVASLSAAPCNLIRALR
jgi:hypothetical protein